MSCSFFIDSTIFWDPSFPSAFFPSGMAMFTCFTFPFHMVLCDQQKLAPCWEAHRKTQASWNKANWARRDPLRLATRSILRWGGWFTLNTGWRCWIIMRGAGKRKVSVGPLLCALNLWTAQRFSWTHRFCFSKNSPKFRCLSHIGFGMASQCEPPKNVIQCVYCQSCFIFVLSETNKPDAFPKRKSPYTLF